MSGAKLAFDGVACRRGGRVLFDAVSFALGPGDALVVRGPNGVGKSSLIRIAAGLLAPTGGTVRADGVRAVLTEAAALDPELPLADALAFWARLDGRSAHVDAAIDAVGLAAIEDVPVRMLSTGQRRRAALARVIAAGAAIWLLDEPLNGLDAGSTAMVGRLIERHRDDGGIVLLASHVPVPMAGAQAVTLG